MKRITITVVDIGVRKEQQDTTMAEKKVKSAMSSRLLLVLSLILVFAASLWTMPQVQAQPAASSAVKLKVQIAAKCAGKAALFRVLNRGIRWPETGVISVYDLDADKLVAKRRLRLTEGQQASFKIRKSGQVRNLGVFVAPGWFDRPFKYDAKLSCG